MFCPKCKCEYIEGVTECIDCHIPLVHELTPEKESGPEYPRPATPEIESGPEFLRPVTFRTYPDKYEAALAKGLLEENGIDAFVPENSGDVLQQVVRLTYGGHFLIINEEDAGEVDGIFDSALLPLEEREPEGLTLRKVVSTIYLLNYVSYLGHLFRQIIDRI
ncbi:MAG: hypothetical protein GY950_29320 [bacterium]|nr:hypothetical protein [bacterium]